MEEVPFIYGKIAIGKDFCDREKETTYSRKISDGAEQQPPNLSYRSFQCA